MVMAEATGGGGAGGCPLTKSVATTVWGGQLTGKQLPAGVVPVMPIGYVPGGVVADVDTITWPVAWSALKFPGGARRFGGGGMLFGPTGPTIPLGRLNATLAPGGRPPTVRKAGTAQTCEVMVTA